MLYASASKIPFTYDDYYHFVENPRVLHPHSIADIFKNGRQETRPIYNLSLAAQARFFGAKPAPAHVANVVLHLLAATLVFFLVQRLTFDSKISFYSAALFVAHPIAVESVAYFNSRSGLLALVFSLSGILFLLSKFRWAFGIGILFLVLAISSKEDAVATPLIALALNSWLAGRGEREWSRKEKTKVLGAMSTLLFLYILFRSPHVETVGVQVEAWYSYLWHQGIILPLHFSLYLWPWPLTLDRDLPEWILSPWMVGLGWFLLAAIGTCLWMRRRSIVSIALLCAVLSLLPTHSIVPLLDIHATRLLYPSLPWISLAAVAFVFAMRKHSHAGAIALLVSLSMFFAWRTKQQVQLWTEPMKLWRKNSEAAPNRWRSWVNLSVELGEAGRWDEAADAILRAEGIAPQNPSVLYNEAVIWGTRTDGKKDTARALSKLRETLIVDPTHVRAKALMEQLTPRKSKKK